MTTIDQTQTDSRPGTADPVEMPTAPVAGGKTSAIAQAESVAVTPPTGTAGMFAAFKHRNYRLFFIGQLVSLIGTWMQIVAQGWLVYQLTGQPFYLGLVGFAGSLPSLLLMLHAGVIIDRLPKRNLLVVTQTAQMVLAFALAALAFLGIVQPWHILVLAFFTGAANTFDAPARQAFVVEMVARQDLTNAIAMNSAEFNAARIIGPALAGITLAAFGAAWCFFINGLSFLAVIASLLMMTVVARRMAPRSASMTEQVKEGLGYVRNNSSVLGVLILVGAASIFGFSYATLLPAFAQDVLGQGELALGYMSAGVGLGALTAALFVAWLGARARKGMLMTIGNFLFPLMLFFFSSTRSLPLACLALACVGFSFMLQNTMANSLIQGQVPDALRGRVMSLYMFTFSGLAPLGNLEAGTLAQQAGTAQTVAFNAILMLLAAIVLAWRVPKLRNLR